MCAVSSMDRVADFESVGWGFESLTACQNNLPDERASRLADFSLETPKSAERDLPAARTYKRIKRDENPKVPHHNPRCSSIFQYPSASFDWDGTYIT